MALFDIFGDHLALQTKKHVSRQPLSNIENMGKMVTTGPIKPNEPAKSMKKGGEPKKSFLSNTGKALQSTPRAAFTPKANNVLPFIYHDETNTLEKGYSVEDLEFTKPLYRNDNSHKDALDFLPMPELQKAKHVLPPNTPPPVIARHNMDFDCSYQDEFFTDDFSNESIPDDDLGLPELY
ncbi:uncharacterized protein LOC120633863 [Pararge aegeria]|uniref:Jg26246 protein n=2 Tax=Pararge aegeria TaxID=116150 RepID=A0A8S4R9E4_9NEOP|nr:uncharacterized protein LOC120633863 [Pararge aegeria]CAH2233400.1 jg26246 [Pararge aegeria aegeria]